MNKRFEVFWAERGEVPIPAGESADGEMPEGWYIRHSGRMPYLIESDLMLDAISAIYGLSSTDVESVRGAS